MSRIDDLLAELAPNGVEYRPLGQIATRPRIVKWSDVGARMFRYIDLTSVDRATRRIDATALINSETAPSRAQQIVETGDVLFATTRPTQMRWAAVPPDLDGHIASTGFCVLRPIRQIILTNYLGHVLGTESFRAYLEANQVAGNYPSISDARLRAYRIPVPPLEVQREIVRILDTLDAEVTELTANLTAELAARRTQYEYYRDTLLTFREAPA